MFATNNIQQTIKCTYEDIQNGDDPWVALGDFANDWFGRNKDIRAGLVAEPLELPIEAPSDQVLLLRQWAAFCAASVEYLCHQADLPVPEWVNDTRYALTEEEVFYTSPLAYKQRVRERLQLEAPEPFRRRNVFCSERVYATKHDEVLSALQSA